MDLMRTDEVKHVIITLHDGKGKFGHFGIGCNVVVVSVLQFLFSLARYSASRCPLLRIVLFEGNL